MKRTYILNRWDIVPRNDVSAVISKHCIPGQMAATLPVPGAIITIFQSESSFEEIAKDLQSVSNIFYTLQDVSDKKFTIKVPHPESQATLERMLDLPYSGLDNPYRQLDLDSLNRQLKVALSEENYEKAAELRDLISKVHK